QFLAAALQPLVSESMPELVGADRSKPRLTAPPENHVMQTHGLQRPPGGEPQKLRPGPWVPRPGPEVPPQCLCGRRTEGNGPGSASLAHDANAHVLEVFEPDAGDLVQSGAGVEKKPEYRFVSPVAEGTFAPAMCVVGAARGQQCLELVLRDDGAGGEDGGRCLQPFGGVVVSLPLFDQPGIEDPEPSKVLLHGRLRSGLQPPPEPVLQVPSGGLRGGHRQTSRDQPEGCPVGAD